MTATDIPDDILCDVITNLGDKATKTLVAIIRGASQTNDKTFHDQLRSLTPHKLLIAMLESIEKVDITKMNALKATGVDLKAVMADLIKKNDEQQSTTE